MQHAGNDLGRRPRRAAAFAAAVALTLMASFPSGCGKLPATATDQTYTLGFESSTAQVVPGGTVQLKIKVKTLAGDQATDGTAVKLTPDSSLGNVSPAKPTTSSGVATSTFTAGTTAGKTTITATLGDASAKVEITIDKNAKETTTTTTVDTDDIDLSTVTWLHPDPSKFTVTATLSNIKISGSTISWDWTHPSRWPSYGSDGGGVIGNNWVFAKINGRWYAATWEWLRDTTNKVTLEAKSGEPPFIQSERSPINEWYPKSGEEIGFMVSTCVRGGIPSGDRKSVV
jgi:hypothetical protein